MLSTSRATVSAESSAIRFSWAQSTATSTRSDTSAGQRRSRPSSGMKPYSPGSGASLAITITVSLPSCCSTRCIASSEPSASPSGFSCVVTAKRSCVRSASATACRSLIVCVGCELIDQLGHAHAALDRRIVLERQLRSPLQGELAAESRLQQAVRRLEPLERRTPPLLAPEHADEDARVAQVGRGLDAGNRDQTDARVLQLWHGLREHLLHEVVDAPHPIS